MNTAVTQQLFSGLPNFKALTKKELFREKFQRSMSSCVEKGFSVEESFDDLGRDMGGSDTDRKGPGGVV